MSIATVTTLGYSISGGLSAGTATLPTLGYGIGAAPVLVPAPYYVAAAQARTPGAEASEGRTPGAAASQGGLP